MEARAIWHGIIRAVQRREEYATCASIAWTCLADHNIAERQTATLIYVLHDRIKDIRAVTQGPTISHVDDVVLHHEVVVEVALQEVELGSQQDAPQGGHLDGVAAHQTVACLPSADKRSSNNVGDSLCQANCVLHGKQMTLQRLRGVK